MSFNLFTFYYADFIILELILAKITLTNTILARNIKIVPVKTKLPIIDNDKAPSPDDPTTTPNEKNA